MRNWKTLLASVLVASVAIGSTAFAQEEPVPLNVYYGEIPEGERILYVAPDGDAARPGRTRPRGASRGRSRGATVGVVTRDSGKTGAERGTPPGLSGTRGAQRGVPRPWADGLVAWRRARFSTTSDRSAGATDGGSRQPCASATRG